ncbi:MAG TPA: hypothetical protein PLN69_02855 [bacterium]|nr:hypothetical protein [bacterium]
MKYDVTIVGDRFVAWAAAAALANRGMKCLLAGERDSGCGCSRIDSVEGFKFDFGVLADRLVCPEPEPLMSSAGLPCRLLPAGRPVYFGGSKLINIPSSSVGVMSSPLLNFGGRKEWVRMKKDLKKYRGDNEAYPVSVADWLSENNQYGNDLMELINIRCAEATDEYDISVMPLAMFAEILHDRSAGSLTVPLGGWNYLVERMKSIIEGGGGQVRIGEKPELIIEDKTAKGVRLSGDVYETDMVIIAEPVTHVIETIPEDVISEDAKKMLGELKPLSGLSLDLGLEEKIVREDGVMLTLEPYTTGVAVSNIEPALAPRGCQNISWFIPVEDSGLESDDVIKRVQRQTKDVLEVIFPGITKKIAVERWKIVRNVLSALPAAGDPDRTRPGIKPFMVENMLMVNDAVGQPGFKAQPSADAALDAIRICEQSINSK